MSKKMNVICEEIIKRSKEMFEFKSNEISMRTIDESGDIVIETPFFIITANEKREVGPKILVLFLEGLKPHDAASISKMLIITVDDPNDVDFGLNFYKDSEDDLHIGEEAEEKYIEETMLLVGKVKCLICENYHLINNINDDVCIWCSQKISIEKFWN